MKIVPNVLSQHAEEAAFLWLLRDAAVRAPHYSLKELARLDSRLEAHLDGLRVAGPHGWTVLEQSLAFKEPGEVFAAAVIAFESGDAKRTERVLNAAIPDPALGRGIVSAIGWLPPKKADRLLKTLIASPDPGRRRLGIAGAAIRRINFEKAFVDGTADADPRLRARSLRALAETGQVKHLPLAQRDLGSVDPEVAWAAAWAAALLTGEPGAIASLQEFGRGPGRRAGDALVLASRRMTVAAAAGWRDALAASPDTLRAAAAVAGASGDPAAIPWLLETMAVPAAARAAGEAFSMISGADLAFEDLDRDAPPDFESGPTDDPKDEAVDADPDEHLPWPDVSKVRSWWEPRRASFSPAKRYLLGKEISAGWARSVLKTGRQRQRHAAALELALLEPGTPLVEVRGPAFRV